MADQAFEAVVAAHHGEIHRYLARVTRRPSDADDLSQETFLRAYRAHGRLAPDANVRAWLFAIATNLCRNHWRSEARRRRAHEAIGQRDERRDGGGPEGEAVLEQASKKIDAIVIALPLKQRLAFTMRKIHELDYDAIGQSLDCSAESARAHVFQALRKVRRALGDLAIAQVGRGEPSA
ncbi:MAG TPA: RNA polymerase sigma factor [Methylomirabilota bacterium]|nr:RNA polymerase sigma factor [Methylomirabilota bacterium]